MSSNYYYIVASLPAISHDTKFSGKTAGQIIEEIRTVCEPEDIALIDRVVAGFDDKNLTPEFYREALDGKNAFLHDYYAFDLAMRNAKVRYLNKALARPADKDVMDPGTENVGEPLKIGGIFEGHDILARERAIDDLYWDKLNELCELHYFDMNVVLAFILKLHIVDRWHVLDEETGREMFRKLVDEVRGTFKGVEYNANPTPAGRRAAR